MKTLKRSVFLIVSSISIANIEAMRGLEFGPGCEGTTPEIIRPGALAKMREERDRAEAELKDAEEARITSAYIREISGNTLIDSLLAMSDREKMLELNKLSTRIKERLIELIKDKRNLLDKNDEEEFKAIKKLRDLKNLIEEDLNS